MSMTSFRLGRLEAFSAKTSNSARSCSITSRASGRWILMTTFSPVARDARWTCAIVPAASGWGSTVSNTSSHGTPSSCSITDTTCASVSGGTSSWRVASSSMNSVGRRSGRVERICPSLQNVGPSSSSAVRSRLAWRRRPTTPSSSGRPKSSRSPCLAKTTPIFVPRATRCGWVTASVDRRADRGRGRRAPDGGRLAVRRVHDDHRAASVVADPVRDVAEQELLAARHPGVADDEHVDRLVLGGAHDRHRGVVVDHDVGEAARSPPAAWCTPAARRPRCAPGSPRRLRARYRRRAAGTITWTTWSSAPNRSAKEAAHSTALAAVSERSVPTITRWTGPTASVLAEAMRASWRLGPRQPMVRTRGPRVMPPRIPAATRGVGILPRPPE